MPDPSTCPECGNPLPAASPHGLCPACLLKRGLEPNTLPNTAPSVAWAPPSPAEIAPHFPELDILRLIGRGGMGAVYQARQKNLDRQVALKILPPEISRDPSFTDRFSREAQAMARLNHPHIVTIHEFGERQGLYYFLMEFVDGVSLRELLSTGHVTPKEALAIVPQICEALQYAHEQGIVHRDIKPENILINKQGQVKIADFGLAKLMGQTAPSPRDTAIAGTPQYMAPEQLERPAEVDHRADIYSLGVVFYQMLTGELPTGHFTAPSKKVQIDVRLDEVVLKALEREPEKRYQQVSQVQTEVTMITQTPWRAAYAQPKSPPPAEGEAAGGGSAPSSPLPEFQGLIRRIPWAWMLFPLLIQFITILLIYMGDGFPQRELFGIFVLWMAIMLAIAAAAFSIFLFAQRAKGRILQPLVAAIFIVITVPFVVGLSHGPHDALSDIPILIHIIFLIIYALLLILPALSKPDTPQAPATVASPDPAMRSRSGHFQGVFPLVGTRAGQRVIHWPGAFVAAALLLIPGQAVALLLYLGGIWQPSIGAYVLLPALFAGTLVGRWIWKDLHKPLNQLTPLDTAPVSQERSLMGTILFHALLIMAAYLFFVIAIPRQLDHYKQLHVQLPASTLLAFKAAVTLQHPPAWTAIYFLALIFLVADGALCWQTQRTGSRRLSTAWSTLVVLSVGAIVLLAAGALRLPQETASSVTAGAPPHPAWTAAPTTAESSTSQVKAKADQLRIFQHALEHIDPPDTLVLAIGPGTRPPEMNRPGVYFAREDSAWFTMDEDWAALQSQTPPHRATVFLGKRFIDRIHGQVETPEEHLVAVDVEMNGKELIFFTSSWSGPVPQPGTDFTRVATIRDFPPGNPPKSIRVYAGEPYGSSDNGFTIRIVTDSLDERLDGRLMDDGSVRLTPRRGFMPNSGWDLVKAPNTPLTPWDSCLRDIYGGGPQIGNNGWVLGTPVEKTVPLGSGINLATGEILPPPAPISSEKEKAIDLIATREGLRAVEMQVKPVFGDAWNPSPPQVAEFIDSIPHNSPPLTSLVPTGNPTYNFRTGNGRMGVLQILATNQTPRATKIRYKLFEHTGPPTQGVFASLAQLLNSLPADAQPDPKTGWDEFSAAKASKWFEEHINGKGFPLTVESSLQEVNVHSNTDKTLRWGINFSLDIHPPREPGLTLSLENADNFLPMLGPSSFISVSGDETFARAAKALSSGAHISVSGGVARCRVYPSLGLIVSLDAPAVTWKSSPAP